MGHPSGFLNFDRTTRVTTRSPVEERVKTWKEFNGYPSPDEELARQGARCMDCGIPFCHSTGCPVYNLIPEWNDLVYRGDWQRSPHPPGDDEQPSRDHRSRSVPAPCEASCTLAINTSPVTIKQLELAIVERGFSEGWVVPRPPRTLTGQAAWRWWEAARAGMAAAQQLRRGGHEVTRVRALPEDRRPPALRHPGLQAGEAHP